MKLTFPFIFHPLKDDKQHSPVQRNTANARERARMRVLSSAFYRLKTIIPWVPHDTKLSKLDTLRLARNYIAYLTATLDGQPVNEITNKMPHPQKMVKLQLFIRLCYKQRKSREFIFKIPPAQVRFVSIGKMILTTFPFLLLSRLGKSTKT